MALSTTQVSQLYVAIFNRASDGAGNTYWQDKGSMIEVAGHMMATPDAEKYFGDTLHGSNKDFVTFIYNNTLGREPDEEGLAYWVELLDKGMSKAELVAHLVTAAIDNKEAVFANKVAVSDYAAENTDEVSAEDIPAFQDMIKDVTEDESSVEDAKKVVDAFVPTTPSEPSVPGETYYLKVDQDVLTGTENDDTFVAVVAQNILGQQTNTLGSGDIIDGGKGHDTLDATVVAGAWVGNTENGIMGIAPITKGVEDIVLHAKIANYGFGSGDNNATVVLEAGNMDGVLKMASNHSDASVIVTNMIGPVKGVYGGTSKQTIAMEYSGNKDTDWCESNMTVYYDQDYLARSQEQYNALYYYYQDVDAARDDSNAFKADSTYRGIGFEVNGEKYELRLTDEEYAAFHASMADKDVFAQYSKIADLLNAKLEGLGLGDGWEVLVDKAIYRTDDGKEGSSTANPLVVNAWAIILKAPEGVDLDKSTAKNLTNGIDDPNRNEFHRVSEDGSTNDVPVSINVDLEKVGNAADGGFIKIGSMNKDEYNAYGHGQDKTTTDTVAGFDEFNVHVAGDKSKNSSLSSMHSTNNTLRAVTIDSKDEGNANLTIGNSNSAIYDGDMYWDEVAGGMDSIVEGTTALSYVYANIFKDVQIMDASKFNGDLTLKAGFTSEIVDKYLKNVEETTLYGLNDSKTELAHFQYNGGNGNDNIDVALDLNNFAVENFAHATETNGLNVFKMTIDGGAGDDTITVRADTATTGSSATNITINGGAGNDIIDITSMQADGNIANSNGNTWTFNVAFDGTNFGHDTVKGFDIGAVSLTDEAQTLDLAGFTAHAGEVIVITLGEKTHTIEAAGNMTDVQIAAAVASALDVTTTQVGGQFTSSVVNSVTNTQVDLAATDKNVNSVTVEIQKHKEVAGSYDKDMEVIHSSTSTTQQQGGLLEGANGADTLDFSAYDVANIYKVVGGTATAISATEISTAGGKGAIYLEANLHDTNVYNVYYNSTTDDAGVTKGTIIGSISLEDASGKGFDLGNITDSQFLI